MLQQKQKQTPPSAVSLRRVLPVMSSHPAMVARRFLGGRLRFIRTGVWVYLLQEDFLELCQDVWDSKLPKSRHVTRRKRPTMDDQSGRDKPIQDGKLDLWTRINHLQRRMRKRD